ncbi:MAG: 16S rRNA (adenine(1518)-N(6)/adenine(1519)-N(6))-dimethyltransferase RsmA [Gammaproteobacteria bacterium]|nr:16S rRNA (adenine(1518)-N(6)/adenine(1519)-N(6))-dimethyltransferase RsmA [Gammaproteobacteria bacterium]NND53933.1 16S rRNA (adenine(1518)-N(6)/adenine(1519)-N(6))-dimethyltransferase RsmA [Gammaproteobacteria bacterium]
MTEHQARKRFGQNFLHDPAIIARLVDAIAPADTDHIIEIGPGQGAMTQPLSQRCGRLEVIELDRDLADRLEQEAWMTNVALHRGDALHFDFSGLSTAPRSLRLAGNLPYNISTPLLFHILTYQHLFRDVHVMLQREVVDRMTAAPGSRTYGRLSVALAARCEVESLFVIKPGAFRPAPKVQSAFARLIPHDKALIAPAEAAVFDEVLRCAFSQRRKQLGNALRPVLDSDAIRAAGIDPQQRAEQLHVEQFVALTREAIARSG